MTRTKTGRFALSAGAVAVVAGSLLGAPLAASAAEGDPLDINVASGGAWATGDEQIITVTAANNTGEDGTVSFVFDATGDIGTGWDQSTNGHTSVPVTASVDGVEIPVAFTKDVNPTVSFDVPASKTATVSAPITMRPWTTKAHTESVVVSGSTLTTGSTTVNGDCQTGIEAGCGVSWELPQAYTAELTLASTPATGGTVERGDTITYTLTALSQTYAANTSVIAEADLSGLFADATLVDGSLATTSGTATFDADNRLNWTTDGLHPAGLGDNGRGDPVTATFQVTVDEDATEGSTLAAIAGGYAKHPLFAPWEIEAAMDPTTGVITPTVPATSNLTVVGKDVVPTPAITVIDVADQVNTVGDAVSVPVVASSTDGSTLVYSASGLPEGVTIDAATGVISGAPTTAGDYSVTVDVSSDTVAAVESTFAWTVTPVSVPADNTDNGTTDNGTTDNGTTDNGTTDNGTTDNGTAANGSGTGASVNTGGAVESDSTTAWLAVGSALVLGLGAAAGVLGFRRLRAQRS